MRYEILDLDLDHRDRGLDLDLLNSEERKMVVDSRVQMRHYML